MDVTLVVTVPTFGFKSQNWQRITAEPLRNAFAFGISFGQMSNLLEKQTSDF